MPAQQARYFILTIPSIYWQLPDDLPELCCWIKGQEELGEGGLRHFQFVCATTKKTTPTRLKLSFCNEAHIEITRSVAAESYVCKEETRIAGTQFELGAKQFKRNNPVDWEDVWDKAKEGDLCSIPADIRIRSYHTLKRIRKDYDQAPWRDGITCHVFWGVTGSGKSHRMYQEAGRDAYVKSPTTKWWDGYTGQLNVILDEFRGQIAVEHLLKWLDKYPCCVEEKGGQLALRATSFWISSNKSPDEWYQELDKPTLQALKRRMRIIEFTRAYQEAQNEHQEAVNVHEEYDPGWLDRLINDD